MIKGCAFCLLKCHARYNISKLKCSSRPPRLRRPLHPNPGFPCAGMTCSPSPLSQARTIGVQEGGGLEEGNGFYRIPFGPTSCGAIRGRSRKAWFSVPPAARLTAILAGSPTLPQSRTIRVQEGRRSGGGEPKGAVLLWVPLLQAAFHPEPETPPLPPSWNGGNGGVKHRGRSVRQWAA